MLSYDDEQKMRLLYESQLAEEVRTEEEIEFWFSIKPKQKKWKAAQTKEWRVRLAIDGVPENRAIFLKPFIDKKPSRADFNTAHVAAVLGTQEAFELAKKRKADFSSVWQKGTCMSIAAGLGHLDFIKLLLEDGCPYAFVTVNSMAGKPLRLSPLRAAVTGRHSDVVDLFKEHAISEDIGEAIRVGNLEALAALKEYAELPDSFVCADEKSALAVLENFPDVSPSNLTCGKPYGADLASAIATRHPALDAAQVASHMGRMSLDGLKVLFDACADLNGKVMKHSTETTLANVAMEGNRVDVLQDLVGRGFKPSGIKAALESDMIYDEMLAYLVTLDAPQSLAQFLVNPYATGFEGRFGDPIFGIELGKKLDASHAGVEKLLSLHRESADSVVEGFSLSSYLISGDAWAVISAELDKRFSSRDIDGKEYRAWSGDGLNVKWAKKTDEAGTELTLTVTRGAPDTRATEAITDELLEELTHQFTSMFAELTHVSVEHKDGELTFSGNASGGDGGVVVTWPTSPLVDGNFEQAFVDAVLSDLQASEFEDEDY